MLKKIFLIAAMTSFLPGTLFARIAMKLEMNRSAYLRYEKIYARLTMRNDSGQIIVFGRDPKLSGTIDFEFTDHLKKKVALRGKTYAPAGLVLKPGETRELYVPLSAVYDFTLPGVYRGYAYVTHPMLVNQFRTNECLFDIREGAKVWSQTAGVPKVNASAGKIEERTFVIRSLVDNAVKHYFLVVEDDKKVYAVWRLGQEVGMEEIRKELDGFSSLHLLVPISPRIFRYLQIGCDGRREADRYYKTTSSIPQMVKSPDTGIVRVIGGAVAEEGVDYGVKANDGDIRDAR